MVKKLLLSGLAAIIMGFSPSCDNGGDGGYECISKDDCAETEQCVEGVCEESRFPIECSVKEYLDNQFCEDFTGEYIVQESTCSNKYSTVFFKTAGYNSDADSCTVSVLGKDKKTAELDCLTFCDSECNEFKGNKIHFNDWEDRSFIKCDSDFVKMKWYNGDCEAWLEKVSSQPGVDFGGCDY